VEPSYAVAAALVKPLTAVLFRRDFRGQEHIPAEGGAIVAVNHVSIADPFAVGVYVHDAGRRPRLMGKASVFRLPVIGHLLRGAGQIPVDRHTADARLALAAAAEAVRSGEVVVIYPEGTTTRDPGYWPMRARTGVARLAIDTGAPVVPLAVWGPQEFLGRGGRFRPVPRKTLRALAGPPVDLSAWRDGAATPDDLRDCTAAVMRDITALVARLRGEQPPAVPFDPRAAHSTGPDDDNSRRSA
jgi:1-acyl-sn-glycerol-3-phosphate acyltransferase